MVGHMMRHGVRLLFVLTVASLLTWTSTTGAAPAPPVSPLGGTITAVDASSLTVSGRSSEVVRVAVTADTRIIRRQQVGLQDIKPNELVGVTAKREPDGSLTAVSINIFPPEFKGRVRESQFLMETGNVMTNATVFQNVRRVDGRTLYLKLPDGTAVIAVPRTTDIFRLTQLTLGDLRTGMRVVVRVSSGSDGSLVAASVTVEAPPR
jgi:hypothetical protein